ncbi:bifunctional 2-C-methyl-D-erythritol 4-phosphate cytidylyltransferase/2-C-methyl-D-erythritol 2,4-cyclodiphosphate synthase [Marinibaculum pumilum]|uniref:Bifunctional enzyme IspD/IspF n=1 Tax=Marinibaculum pumilum TaxID=1766165 RepID=A0ABV7KUG6_9PROT
MTVDALIVAAGRGLRVGGGLPKQYRPAAGRALLWHACRAFLHHPAIRRVQVVISAGDEALYRTAVGDLDLPPPVAGGATRQESVHRGLAAMAAAPPERVLIHDAARPFPPADMIDRVVAALQQAPGALAALPVPDTLKLGRTGPAGLPLAAQGPSRDGLWRAQTPQGFRFDEILAAHRQAQAAGFAATDDAAIAEWAGLDVVLVQGAEDNFKVTDGNDLARAAALAEGRHAPPPPSCATAAVMAPRVGQGFDVHRFATPGTRRPLQLCGVTIPGATGLAGHSDADVGIHALCDAIYGALAEGDIGAHFPPSDGRYRNADSALFLEHARDRIAARGGRLCNADVTLICEAPRIGPHRQAMRARLAQLLAVAEGRISVKATTTERLGFLGRGEGIAAQAAVTIALPDTDG